MVREREVCTKNHFLAGRLGEGEVYEDPQNTLRGVDPP